MGSYTSQELNALCSSLRANITDKRFNVEPRPGVKVVVEQGNVAQAYVYAVPQGDVENWLTQRSLRLLELASEVNKTYHLYIHTVFKRGELLYCSMSNQFIEPVVEKKQRKIRNASKTSKPVKPPRHHRGASSTTPYDHYFS